MQAIHLQYPAPPAQRARAGRPSMRLGGNHRRPARPGQRRGSAARAGGLLFHVPSFSVGLILGAVIVLGTGYLPEILGEREAVQATAGIPQRGTPPRKPEVTFEFDTMLRNAPTGTGRTPVPAASTSPAPDGAADSTVTSNSMPPVAESEPDADRPPQHTTAPAGATPNDATGDYLLQAASFRNRTDADRLRAELLLLDLPAATGEVTLGTSVWYRVTVGPFEDQASADAALARLHERNLAAIVVRR